MGDTDSAVVQVPDCRGSRRDRGKELTDGAGSHLVFEGKAEALLCDGMKDAVRTSRSCVPKKMEAGGVEACLLPVPGSAAKGD